MEKENHDEIQIDIVRTIKSVLRKLPFIFIVVCLTYIVTYSYFSSKKDVSYSTTGKIYVIDKEQKEITLSIEDLDIGSELVEDYLELITSRVVLEKVIYQLKLDMTYDELKDCVTTQNPADTRIIEITVEYDDVTQIEKVLNEIEDVTCKYLSDKIGAECPIILERACEPTHHYITAVGSNTKICTLGAAFFLIVFFALQDIFNGTIRYRDEVEEYLNLDLIGDIPHVSKPGIVLRN